MRNQHSRSRRSLWNRRFIRLHLPFSLLVAGAGIVPIGGFGTTALAMSEGSVQEAESSWAFHFNIPSQPLTGAINAYAEITGWQVSFPADLAVGKTSAEVRGAYMPEEALLRLLDGTGLTYRFTDFQTFTLLRDPQVSSSASAAVSRHEANLDSTLSPPIKATRHKRIEVPEIVVKDVKEQGYAAREAATATKDEVPLIEAPQSITVITRNRMVAQEVNSVTEALRYTAGVHAEPIGFEPRMTFFRIRGFDATTNGLFKDGLQLRNPGFAVSYNLEPYGAEQLDLLRGPASFLYGQGSPGGLLNYVSKRPTQQPLRELQFLAGNFNRFEGRFDFGGRLNDSEMFSYRLTGLFRESGTQVDHVANDRVFLAPALTWRMGSQTNITFFANYQRDNLGFSQALPVEGTLRTNPNGRISPNRFTGLPGVDKYIRQEHSVGYELEHHLAEGWHVVQKLRYNANKLDDVSTFGFAFDADQRTLNRARQDTFGDLWALTLDNQVHGRFTTGPVEHAVLGGIDFWRTSAKSRINVFLASSINIFDQGDFGTPETVPFSNFDQDTTQWQTGLYIQDRITVYDNWLLTIGGRYDWARNEISNNLTNTQTQQSDHKGTGRAALTYVFDFGLAPYVSYSTFFLPTVGTDVGGNSFKPETGRQFEFGIKYQPPGSRSFFTASLFDLTRENFVTTDPGTFLPIQRGKVRSRGLELEAVASFDIGVDLLAAYTLLDNEVRETADPVERGKWLPRTPGQFASLWVKYTVPVGRLKGVGIGGGARYTGAAFADPANTFKIPSFVVGDAAVDYVWRGYRLALNVTNILNHDQFGCFERVATTFCTFGERRTVVGTIGYRW